MLYFVWKEEVGEKTSMKEPTKETEKTPRDAPTEKEVEEDEVFWETFDNFKDFIDQKTNCTVLRNDVLEADDLIAGWVQAISK